MCRAGRKAGEAYAACADAEIKLENMHAAATYFVDAANCYKKVDPDGASATPAPPDPVGGANQLQCVRTLSVLSHTQRWLLRTLVSLAPADAINFFQLAIKAYCEVGRFLAAARVSAVLRPCAP